MYLNLYKLDCSNEKYSSVKKAYVLIYGKIKVNI